MFGTNINLRGKLYEIQVAAKAGQGLYRAAAQKIKFFANLSNGR